MKLLSAPVFALSLLISFSTFASDFEFNEEIKVNVSDLNLLQPSFDAEEFEELLASELATEEERASTDHHKCPGVSLTDQQKKNLGLSIINFKKARIDYTAEIHKAKLDYIVLLYTPSTSTSQAANITSTILENSNKKTEEKLNLANKIFFDILTFDQRAPAFHCLMKMKKAHRSARH